MTVGYGDIRPDDNFSRVVLGCFIISMIIFLSKETSALTELIKKNPNIRFLTKEKKINILCLLEILLQIH